jgi:hypothetical protein
VQWARESRYGDVQHTGASGYMRPQINSIYYVFPDELEIKHEKYRGEVVHIRYRAYIRDTDYMRHLQEADDVIRSNNNRLANIYVLMDERMRIKYRFVECSVVEMRNDINHVDVLGSQHIYGSYPADMSIEIGFSCIYHEYQPPNLQVEHYLNNQFSRYYLGRRGGPV